MSSGIALEIRLLGPLEVLVNGVPVQLRGGRARALLAVLALAAGEAVPTDVLIARVWGEPDLPGDLRGNLYTYVRRLRGALGPSVIATAAGGYRLDVDPDCVDARRFLTLLDRADQHRADQYSAGQGQDGGGERQLLDEALGLWRGGPYDEQSDWLSQCEAPRFTERYLTALERRADLDLAAGRHNDLVAELRELTRQHPLREPLWTRLLLALAKSGRHAEAFEAYEAIRRRLADELGVDPSPELRQIHADLLEGAAPGLPGGARGVDRPASVVPQQLPADLAGFTGRADVIKALDGLLEESGSPTVLALHGGGGIGKTTLAVHWAHRVKERFPDGQLFVDLRGYGPGSPTAPAEALDGLLRGLGISGAQIPEGVDPRSALLRSTLADRRVLIILDNARDAEQVRPLLPGAGGPAVVVTSRSQLRGLATREGAKRIAVETLSGRESVTLLRDRLSDHEVLDDVLVELAELCGHLPLALAIAAERAGRSKDGALDELFGELRAEQDRLDALDSGEDASSNLRSVFSWSYSALDPDTARMFRLIGLHPVNQFSGTAAAALVGSPLPQARKLLDRLVEANLLQAAGDGRYAMHDLVRDYANELVETASPVEEREAAIARLDSWYVHTAANARKALKGPTMLGEWGDLEPQVHYLDFSNHHDASAWFADERAALFALISLGAPAGRYMTTSRLARLLYRFLANTNGYAEAVPLCRIAAEAARVEGDQVAEASARHQLAMAHWQLCRYGEAGVQLEIASELYRTMGNRDGECRVIGDLGLIYSDTGRLNEAIEVTEQQYHLALELGLTYYISHSQNNLAAMYRDTGRLADAVRVAGQAVDGHRSAGDQVNLCQALDTLGSAHLAQGAADDAAKCFEEALGLARELGHRWGEAVILRNLGTAWLQLARFAEARRSIRAAVDIVDQIKAADTRELRRSDLIDLLAQLDRELA